VTVVQRRSVTGSHGNAIACIPAFIHRRAQGTRAQDSRPSRNGAEPCQRSDDRNRRGSDARPLALQASNLGAGRPVRCTCRCARRASTDWVDDTGSRPWLASCPKTNLLHRRQTSTRMPSPTPRHFSTCFAKGSDEVIALVPRLNALRRRVAGGYTPPARLPQSAES